MYNPMYSLTLLLIFLYSWVAQPALAEVLSGSNYQIENPLIGVGDSGDSSSTNYTSSGSFGSQNDNSSSSTNYKVFPGFIQHAYPGVPAQPTLTNTGGTLYNALDFIIATGDGQQTDTTYAIAISADDFTTTYFIQTDDTIGNNPAWQTYTQWGGGSGQRVTGLAANTTYKIKVKARYGADTETAYSATASAATSGATLTITFAGVNSGTSIDGETTTVTTGANNIAFGSLTVGSPKVAAHQITVTTNASGGYTTTLQQDGNLRTTSGSSISPVSGTNSSPASWPGGITTGRFGYHTTDQTLCTGTTSRFSSTNTWAAAETTAYEVSCNTSPVSNEATRIVYKLEIGGQQQAGSYQNILTLITSAQY